MKEEADMACSEGDDILGRDLSLPYAEEGIPLEDLLIRTAKAHARAVDVDDELASLLFDLSLVVAAEVARGNLAASTDGTDKGLTAMGAMTRIYEDACADQDYESAIKAVQWMTTNALIPLR